MIRPGPLAALTVLTLTAAAPIAHAPVAVETLLQAPPQSAPTVQLVPGGLLQDYVVMVFPPAPAVGVEKLNRIAIAVEGAESSYGRNPLMWRADANGPQGPMQVSAAAALDVGGGNRFDVDQNRVLGRAYLARMYGKYGNWRDAVMAYNWGPGNLDQWIDAGRPADALNDDVARYASRVLDTSVLGDDSSLAAAPTTAPAGPPPRLEVREESIRDPRLRRRVHINNQEIAELRVVLQVSAQARAGAASFEDKAVAWLKTKHVDAEQLAARDPNAVRQVEEAAAAAVLSLARDVSRRPGFENFASIKPAKAVPEIGSVRTIASTLLNQLQNENDTLALIDVHR